MICLFVYASATIILTFFVLCYYSRRRIINKMMNLTSTVENNDSDSDGDIFTQSKTTTTTTPPKKKEDGETNKHDRRRDNGVDDNDIDDNDDNDESTVAEYIRPLKKRKNNEFIKLNPGLYKRENVRQTQIKGVSLGVNKEFGSSEIKELTNMFYKNNLLLPTPTKKALSDYMVVQVKLLFNKLKQNNTNKISITKSAPIFVLEAIHHRLNLLFQQVLIHINPNDNRALNRALYSNVLTTLHLLHKNGNSKRFPLLTTSNGNNKNTVNNGSTERNLKPIVLFTSIASLNPSLSHAQGSAPALFTQPLSYDFLSQLHKLYIFLKDSTKPSHHHHHSSSKEGNGTSGNLSTTTVEKTPTSTIEEQKKKKQELSSKIFTELHTLFEKDKSDNVQEKGPMFFCGKGLIGIYKKYGINRSSQFNKFILEAFVCLFLKEVAHKIFIFMVNNKTTQINVDAVRWALKDYGYSC